MRRIGLGMLAVVLTASAAAAQSAPETGYAQGFGGLTFGTATSGGVFGGEVGFTVIENLQIYGTVGRFTNITPDSLQDALDNDFEPACEDIFQANCEAEATTSATFVTAGVKYLFPTNSGIRPYVAGGLGFLAYKIKIEEVDFGDITDEFTDDPDDSAAVFEIGGGVVVPIGSSMQFDGGYKLLKIFENETDPVSRVYGSFGIRF